MSIIDMAVNGLSGLLSRNVTTDFGYNISNTIDSYRNNLTNNAINSINNSVNKKINNVLGSGRNNVTNSSAGNFNASGNNRNGTIYDYLTHFKTGVMKSNRFRVEFNLPRGVVGNTSTYAVNTRALTSSMQSINNSMNGRSSINVKCHQVTFPMRSMQVVDFKCNSVAFKVPYGVSYEPITLTFYSDGNLDTREFFELWQSAVMNFGNNTSNFYNEYVSDVKMYIQNELDNDVYGIILYECFPSSISMVDMSYSTTNMPLNIVITLSFKSWLPLSNSNASSYNRTV